jgi:hypothetical protein
MPYMWADWKRLRPRHETLESRMTRKCHVRFGGKRSEQCLPGNSPPPTLPGARIRQPLYVAISSRGSSRAGGQERHVGPGQRV